MTKIPKDQWEWFGDPGHFICGEDCRFHLCTKVGPWLVSTVGKLLPDAPVREILADTRGVTLEGRGDYRRADFMRKVGYDTVGHDRLYETMVFRAGEPCDADGCDCGLPAIDGSNVDGDGYNDAGSATRGHMALCEKWAGIALGEEDT